jgi:hypothetical protein
VNARNADPERLPEFIALPKRGVIILFGGCDVGSLCMESDVSKFVGEIWQYKPIIIVLAAGCLIIFLLSVTDTHRHRKKVHKKRHRIKHH